ncbi:MBL fold metallo-hydrolase [Sporosarcina sp. CAU 1771]
METRSSTGEKNGVSYLNGKIKFHGVALNVYSFVVDGVLIDTGAESLREHFEQFIDEADFDQVMLTHYHEDHTGCAAYIKKTKKVPIYLSGKTIEHCAQEADYPLYRQLFWGKRRPFQAQEMPETFISRNAQWDVIDTPGHSYDHKALLNRETGQLFTGDLFVNEQTKVILTEESIPAIIQSLEKVLTYGFEDVFCNHRGLVKEGRLALERKLDNLLTMQQDVLNLQKEGDSIESICNKLFPDKYPIMEMSEGEWDTRHIVTSILNGK